MSEHRSLFGTLAVTLIGIGLGGYVSLQVAGAVAGHPVKLGPTENLCLVVLVVGAILFILVCGALWHQRQIKKMIASFTVTGSLLANDARGVSTDDQKGYEELNERFAAWINEIFSWMKKHDINAAIHFGNDAGRLVTEGLMGAGGIAGLRANIDTRMARLGEMAEKRL